MKKNRFLIFYLVFVLIISVYSDMKELNPETLISSLTLKIGELINDIDNSYSKQLIEEEYNKLKSQGDREKFDNIIFSIETLTKQLNLKDGNPHSIRKIKEYSSALSQIIREESYYLKMKEISRQTSLFTNIDLSVFNIKDTPFKDILHNIDQTTKNIELKDLFYISETDFDISVDKINSFEIRQSIDAGEKISFDEEKNIMCNFKLRSENILSYSSNIKQYSKLSDFILNSEESFIKLPLKDSIIMPSTVSMDKNSSYKKDSFIIVNGFIDIIFIKDKTGNILISIYIDKTNSDFFELSFNKNSNSSSLKKIQIKDIFDNNPDICYLVKDNSSETQKIINNIFNKRIMLKSRPYSSESTSDFTNSGLIDLINIEREFQINRGLSSHIRIVDRIKKKNPYESANIKIDISGIENKDKIMYFQGNIPSGSTITGIFAENSGSNFNFFNEYTLIESFSGKNNVSYTVYYNDDMLLEKEYAYLRELGEFITNDNMSDQALFPNIPESGIRNCDIEFLLTGVLQIQKIPENRLIKSLIENNPKSEEMLNKINEYINRTLNINNNNQKILRFITLLKNSTIRKIVLNSLVKDKKTHSKLSSDIY